MPSPRPACVFPRARRARPHSPARPSLLILSAVLLGILLVLACGQRDPTAPDSSVMVGALLVTATLPDGSDATATIWLDGEPTEHVTPATIDSLPIGSYEVSVFLQGYFPRSQEIEVTTGETAELHFELELVPDPGWVVVVAPEAATTVHAEILIDGQAWTTLPDSAQVSAGDHVVSLRVPGFTTVPLAREVLVLAETSVRAVFDELVVPRIMLCEDLSNWDCDPCPAADEALQQVIASHQPAGQLVSMNPHGWWPGLSDPFFQANINAHRARVNFYEVQVLPSVFVDGSEVDEPDDPASIRAKVAELQTTHAPVAISVRAGVAGAEYDVTVDVFGWETGIPASLRLFTFVVETEVVLEPPGPNGQATYHNVMREILPPSTGSGDPGGTPITLAEGDHRAFEYTYVIGEEIGDPGHLAVIAVVQDPESKAIVQTGTTLGP